MGRTIPRSCVKELQRSCNSNELRPEGWWGGSSDQRSCNVGAATRAVLLNFLTNSVKFLTNIARRGAILLNFLIKSAKELQLDLFLSRFSQLYYNILFFYIYFPFNYTKILEKSQYFTTLEKNHVKILTFVRGAALFLLKILTTSGAASELENCDSERFFHSVRTVKFQPILL